MSDENPHSTNGSPKKKWLERLSHLFQGEPRDRSDLVEVIQDAEERDVIDEDTKEMIEGVLEVSELRVRDIMIPRSQMITLRRDQSVATFLPIIIQSAHSRFPVINEDKDHVEGILLAKDLLPYGFAVTQDEFDFDKILRPAVVVPEGKRLDRLLKEFQQERYHMAIVVDEFGSVSGLVTIEDILELIVGEIEDEYDEQDDTKPQIRAIDERHFSVNALTPIEDFNMFFHCQFNDDDVDTIGGAVMHAFGHLPKRGDSIIIEQFQFKILQADRRRLIQLQVTLPEVSTINDVE